MHEKCKVELLSGGVGGGGGAKVEVEMEVEVEDVAEVEAPRDAKSKAAPLAGCCPRCKNLREALHKGAGAPPAQAAAVPPPISATPTPVTTCLTTQLAPFSPPTHHPPPYTSLQDRPT